MRILIKGGVWKNSEDEILKAGIMKYGKNEWGRIATLLPRKTAKQCKRRWYEWLDPMIKKTEWTRQEDEKLLHLAKILPTQWRTIAPMIGRTPGQCLERYGKLLDIAAGTTADQSDPLRLGQFDTNPEDKPARPDPIDMDEDEKEMLGEAKARLANINGKKAKRKARERLLENARRMAKLQKYRELKAAGVAKSTSALDNIKTKGTKKNNKTRELDFANEIVFERKVPVGFYDTAKEDEEAIMRARDAENRKRLLETANEEPQKRAKREREALKRDRERFEKLANENLEAALKEIESRNNAFGTIASRQKQKLVLPEPQVTDAELQDIAKLGRKLRASQQASSSSSSSALQDLEGDYSSHVPSLSRQSATVRTPAAPDIVLEEARNQRVRTTAQTPLVGGESPVTTYGTGFAGYEPTVSSARTPSVYTPSVAKHSVGTGLTKASAISVSTVRDHFKLNADESDATEALVSKQEEREQRKQALGKLRDQLNSLPAPKYSYEVKFNVQDETSDDETQVRVMDASEEEKIEALKRQKAEEEARENRSEVLKRGLPIPTAVSTKNLMQVFNKQEDGGVSKTFVEIVQRDVKEEGPETRSREEKRLLAKALDLMREESRKRFGDSYTAPDLAEFGELLNDARKGLVVWPTNDTPHHVASASNTSKKKKKKSAEKVVFQGPFQVAESSDVPVETLLAAQKVEFYCIANRIQDAQHRVHKTEKKLSTLLLGLRKRAEQAAQGFKTAQKLVDDRTRELDTFKYMRDVELAGIPNRIASWKDRLENVVHAEKELQNKFFDLLTESS